MLQDACFGVLTREWDHSKNDIITVILGYYPSIFKFYSVYDGVFFLFLLQITLIDSLKQY